MLHLAVLPGGVTVEAPLGETSPSCFTPKRQTTPDFSEVEGQVQSHRASIHLDLYQNQRYGVKRLLGPITYRGYDAECFFQAQLPSQAHGTPSVSLQGVVLSRFPVQKWALRRKRGAAALAGFRWDGLEREYDSKALESPKPLS